MLRFVQASAKLRLPNWRKDHFGFSSNFWRGCPQDQIFPQLHAGSQGSKAPKTLALNTPAKVWAFLQMFKKARAWE